MKDYNEDIPSNILWENARVENIQITFHAPLKLKEIFNAEDWEVHDNNIIIVKKVELEGYIGLSFESSKVSALEVVVPLKYTIYLSNGGVIKAIKRIKLFRPELGINVSTKEISINHDTGFVKGRIGIKNIGRGTLMMRISSTEDSSTKLQTPPEHREFAEKFLSDLLEELSNLAKEFPQFRLVLDEIHEWETKGDLLELSDEERNEYAEYIFRLANVLASNKELLQRFVEAYAKALARNIEFIEAIRKFVKIFESLVSRDILLVNALDNVVLTGKKEEITLEISRTDKVFSVYEDITLPKIELLSSRPVKIPIYRLFEWG